MIKLVVVTYCFCLLIVITASPAYAYLDAGTGSMILQLILGGLAGLAVILKVFWHSILGIFGLNKKKKDEADLS